MAKRLEMGEHVDELRRALSKLVGDDFTGRVEVDLSEGEPVASWSREPAKGGVRT